ncbi:hypothetical protein D9M68_374150 [compost metagenome]
MRRLDLLLALLLGGATLAPASPADEAAYELQRPLFASAYPQQASPPPRPFLAAPPGRFVVIPQRHEFHDARLPSLGNPRPRVLIRSYDAELGVYVDSVVRD